MLKAALPRPSPDAVIRSGGSGAWQYGFDNDAEPAFKLLTRTDVEALRRRDPPLSPWRVVMAQIAVGAAVAAVLWLATGQGRLALSALYGAAVVAVPGALMARGTTSPLSAISPLSSTVAMMGWSFVKVAASVAMLVIAVRIVPGLSWPALLATLALCLQTYWFALLWRSRAKAI